MLNFPQKSGVKYARPEADINYNELTPEIIEKYQIVAKGIEEFLGKKCTVYTAVIENEGVKVESSTWVYKGVVLKSIATYGENKQVEMKAVSLDENPSIAADTFVIPSDFVIRAM